MRRCRAIDEAARGIITPCLAGRDTLPQLEERALGPHDTDSAEQEQEENVRAVARFVMGTDANCYMLDEHVVELMDMMLPVHSHERQVSNDSETE